MIRVIVCHVPPFPHWFQWIRGGSKRRAAAAPPRRKQVRWVSRTGSRPPRASNSADLGTCVGRRRSGLRRGRLARQIRRHQEGQPHHRLTEEGLRGSVGSRSAASAVMLHCVNKVLTLLGQMIFFFILFDFFPSDGTHVTECAAAHCILALWCVHKVKACLCFSWSVYPACSSKRM